MILWSKGGDDPQPTAAQIEWHRAKGYPEVGA